MILLFMHTIWYMINNNNNSNNNDKTKKKWNPKLCMKIQWMVDWSELGFFLFFVLFCGGGLWVKNRL